MQFFEDSLAAIAKLGSDLTYTYFSVRGVTADGDFKLYSTAVCYAKTQDKTEDDIEEDLTAYACKRFDVPNCRITNKVYIKTKEEFDALFCPPKLLAEGDAETTYLVYYDYKHTDGAIVMDAITHRTTYSNFNGPHFVMLMENIMPATDEILTMGDAEPYFSPEYPINIVLVSWRQEV